MSEKYSMDESNIGQQILLHSRENTVQENPEILQKVSMSDANTFWMNVLRDCELNRLLPLPYDRHRLLNENQTSHRALFSFDFGEDLTRYIFTYASSKNIPFRDIMIASFCAFLFKICNGERDLCIGMISHHESKEFKLIPDPSVNMIPLRCQLDPHWYFQQLAEHIHETVTKSMEYSYFPLQEILTPRDASKLAFLKICFKFHSYRKEMKTNCEKINCNDQYSTDCAINNTKSVATEVLDLIITIHHDLTMNRLSCTVDASRDVFNVETVDTITQRFHSMLQQVFLLPIYFMMTKPICELSITLPNERLLIQSTNNTSISLPSTNGVHRDFVCQTMKHPQKLAVELDEQFLTYCELLNCIQILSMNFLNEYRIVPGDIVCQCVERSFSMVIGILAIEMVGGVYCPLSPQDPEHRLHALMQQTQSRLVLVNYFTKSIFHDEISFINIDSVIMYDYATYEADTKALSNVIVTPNDIAYIIFTSGSTGTPKAARLRHRNITDWMNTALGIGVINKNDIVAQIARCSFDVHVLDILGTLIIGGSLVMLHPEGISDFEYLARVFSGKQTTYIHAVPSLLRAFFTFLTSSIDFSAVKYFRSVCASGEACSVKLLRFLSGYLSENCVIWNLYGPAEAIGCTFHRFDPIIDTEVVPIGFMMPNYRYEIFDEFLQHIVDNQEGELFIGGVGLYDGYLGRDDLTAAAFVKINSQLYYRTGDILKLTSKGSLLYHGRKDHQIKLHGQRIELGEIEQCILNTSAPFCLVTKWNDHHLIAYVEKSSNINEAQLREHCRKYLPPHMIPSIFILLEDLPLNTNGKVDRKRLPSPNFHHSLSVAENKGGLLLPKDEIEEFVHRVWCQLFHQNRMPMDTNFFAVGGHSLLLMELLWQYKAEYHLNSNTLTINDLSNNITIRDHARVVRHYLNMTPISVGSPLVSLYLTQGPISEPQRMCVDYLDNVLDAKTAFGNVPLAYVITNGCISVKRLRQALTQLINKHAVLRTSFHLDSTTNEWYQRIEKMIDDGYTFVESSIATTGYSEALANLIECEMASGLFTNEGSRRVRLHVIRRVLSNRNQEAQSNVNRDTLQVGDVIILNVRHEAIDGISIKYFLDDLAEGYTNKHLSDQDDNITYLDYTVYERLNDHSASVAFWKDHRGNLDCSKFMARFPYDQPYTHELSNSTAHTIPSILPQNIVLKMLQSAELYKTTLASICLSMACVFLYEVADYWEDDIGVSYMMASQSEISTVSKLIGPFMCSQTLRIHLQNGTHTTFVQLVNWVQTTVTKGLEHAKVSGNDLDTTTDDESSLLSSSPVFCAESDVYIQFDIEENDCIVLDKVDDVQLHVVRNEKDNLPQHAWWRQGFCPFLNLFFDYNPKSKQLSYAIMFPTIRCEESTAGKLAIRFQDVIHKLFGDKTKSDDLTHRPLMMLLKQ